MKLTIAIVYWLCIQYCNCWVGNRNNGHISINLHRLSAAASKGPSVNKIRIRLLKEVKDIGKAGDVVMVNPAVWINLLQPKKLAEIVTNAQLENIENQASQLEKKRLQSAKILKESFSELPILSLHRKSGPNGRLFGTVNAKHILEVFKGNLPMECQKILSAKDVIISVLSIIADQSPTPLMSHSSSEKPITSGAVANVKIMEVRNVGLYSALLRIQPYSEAVSVRFQVVPE